MSRVERIGGATLYLGDAREILPALRRPDAIVSDPPYGQSLKTTFGARGGKFRTGAKAAPPVIGDAQPFDPAWVLPLADNVILWGAHKFFARLPDRGRFLFWDKRPNGVIRTQGCGEMAWHSVPGAVRVCRLLWDGICVQAGSKAEVAKGRVHPTQKPVALMEWCLDQAKVQAGQVVADPYLGSGSTGVACIRRGLRFIGIEMDPTHFDTACRRIEAAARKVSAEQKPLPLLAVIGATP